MIARGDFTPAPSLGPRQMPMAFLWRSGTTTREPATSGLAGSSFTE
jgi:hypothetical protein